MPPPTNSPEPGPLLASVPQTIDAPSPAASKPPDPPPPKHKPGRSWLSITRRARVTASLTALFLALIVLGGFIGYYYSQSRRPNAALKGPAVQSLSAQDLAKLGQIGQNLGGSGQVLNVEADALFRGQADVVGNLTIGGKLNANGSVTLSQLNITGNTAASGLNVGANLNVTGTTTLQNTLTVAALATLQSLTVSGTTNLNAASIGVLTVRSITIAGPLTIGHLITQGQAPAIATGSVGAGGTVSISGNDTSGQVNINTGSNPGTNVTLATVTFKAAYGASVHVELTPLTSVAASAQAYITRSSSGFVIHANSPSAGAVLSFDYLVMQ